VEGVDKTTQISDWEIHWSDKYDALQLKCHFPSTKTYTRPLSECRVSPTRELGEMLLTKPGSTIVTPIAKATIYDERYAVVYYPGAAKPYVHKMEGISFIAPTAMKEAPVFLYFSDVANARQDHAESASDREIAANVVRQLEKLPASADTALQAYCTRRNGTLAPGEGLIYPFGLNESQLAAVEQAFRSQVSVIEGPPGTGKTQTILNILANIVLRGQTVAVLSNVKYCTVIGWPFGAATLTVNWAAVWPLSPSVMLRSLIAKIGSTDWTSTNRSSEPLSSPSSAVRRNW